MECSPSPGKAEDGSLSKNHLCVTVQSARDSRESSTDSSLAAKSDLSNPTENELINIDDIDFSDEDTWLYTPPKSLSSEEKGLSPYKWLRQDVEDPNNRELQIAKTALVSKLNELDILKSVQKPPLCRKKSLPKSQEESSPKSQDESPVLSNCDKHAKHNTDAKESCNSPQKSVTSENTSTCSESKAKSEWKPLNDVTDVLERARQQEESLKQSSNRFFSESARTLPRAQGSVRSVGNVLASRLSKPASVEALHTFNGKTCSSVPASIAPAKSNNVIPSPSCSPYGSTMSLNFNNDSHRSSLPNINKAYHTLKPKKAKRTSEPRVQCPLPAYPKHMMNGGSHEAIQVLVPKSPIKSPTHVYRESQTLPSSYRTKSRSSQRNVSHGNLSRRESDPPPAIQCQRNTLKAHIARRESMPTATPNCLQACSPISRKNQQAFSQLQYCNGSPTSLSNSRTVSLNSMMPELQKDVVIKSYPRCSSHSPVKRQPLTSVHNRSPNKEEHMISSGYKTHRPSLSTKIPSPASRSGIPVPSQFMDRGDTADDSWSQDSY